MQALKPSAQDLISGATCSHTSSYAGQQCQRISLNSHRPLRMCRTHLPMPLVSPQNLERSCLRTREMIPESHCLMVCCTMARIMQ